MSVQFKMQRKERRNYITSEEQVSEYFGGLKWITTMK